MNAVLSPGSLTGGSSQRGTPRVRRTFVVNLEHGLHARPCAMLVQAVRPYSVAVEVEANGEKASGKSILGLMALAAGEGMKITFTIMGENAFQAMADIERLFETRFEPKTSTCASFGERLVRDAKQ